MTIITGKPTYIIKYHLKRKSLRERINLKDYSKEIIESIKNILPGVRGTVGQNYFSFEYSSPKLPRGLAAGLGKEICKPGRSLNEFLKYYYYEGGRVSRQLFVRMDD
ncbi:MAG: hypothetical protein HQM08_28060 [Candidatus Riflebacteria bacterium]|nr:hypothetical protein [Candidatus Riflebacteria bacterium]